MGQRVFWQGLSKLSSLRKFTCYALRCPQHAEARVQKFSGAVAQALWTLALGWPQLTALKFTDCALSSGEVSGNIEAPTGTHPLRCDMVRCQQRSATSEELITTDGYTGRPQTLLLSRL